MAGRRLLESGSVRLLQSGSARLLESYPTARGGTIRRRYAVGRVLRRVADAVRTLARRVAVGRVFRADGGLAVPIVETKLPKDAAEVVLYVADFSEFPEAADHNLASCSVPAVVGLTIATPAVLVAETDGVAAGKGVSVAVSGGTAGTTYTLVVYGTFADTNGSKRAVKAQLVME